MSSVAACPLELMQCDCPAPSAFARGQSCHLQSLKVGMGRKQEPRLGNAQTWALSLFCVMTWLSATFPQVQTLGQTTSNVWRRKWRGQAWESVLPGGSVWSTQHVLPSSHSHAYLGIGQESGKGKTSGRHSCT